MRYLWIVSSVMIALGLMLAAASLSAGTGAIALVCGVLLIWSGIVKIIVLRVWQTTLREAPSTMAAGAPTAPPPRRRS